MADLDAEYVAKREDVLATYEKPYNRKEPVARKVNRAGVKINWQFTRKKARAQFGYYRNFLRRSYT